MKMRGWIKRKVLVPIKRALKNGISQRRLAISLALGITIGLFPFYGITTLLVGAVAWALRLDFLVMQAVHYIVSPIQIALFIPFFKAGNIFINQDVDFTASSFIALFKENFWHALREFWMINLGAILIWGLVALPLAYGLYHLFIYSIKNFGHLLFLKRSGRSI